MVSGVVAVSLKVFESEMNYLIGSEFQVNGDIQIEARCLFLGRF